VLAHTESAASPLSLTHLGSAAGQMEMECSLAVEPLWGFNYFHFVFIALLMRFLKPIKSGFSSLLCWL
jgi:hypothetical protein